MKNTAQAVVIGGGVVGASVLYHLAREGMTDVMLLERDVLTCGSSWHAAGGFHTINGDPNVAKLQKYTIDLYKEIEELSGQSCGVHRTGGVMLAADEQRMEWLRMSLARGKYLGLDLREMSLDEALEVNPFFDKSKFVGAIYDPLDGHLDPYGVTHAYAKSAKILGAKIHEQTKVEDTVPNGDGTWTVVTDKGNIHTENVVNCGGLWAREVGRMAGLELPILAMEHHYLLTEGFPEVAEFNERTGREVGHAVDFSAELYTRQERDGVLIGTYEKNCKPWHPKETPWNFGSELLEPDYDRIMPSLEKIFDHFPAYENAGIRQAVNGPFVFGPDGNPMIGPMRGMPGYWCAVAIMAGFSQGGGVGLSLANWMVHGDPGADIWAMDIARYGDWTTMRYANKKVRENYSRRFQIKFPNEELWAARPGKTTPVYDKMIAAGAQMGDGWGLEVPLWYAPEGVKDEHSFRRSADFEYVGAECKALRDGVGLVEASGFAKYIVTGAGAEAWLDGMLACRIPKPGRMTLAPMLKDDGKVIGDFSLANLTKPKAGASEGIAKVGDGNPLTPASEAPKFLILGAGNAETYHMRWFLKHLPADGSVQIEALGLGMNGLSISGPKSRDLLAAIADEDVSHEAMKFMDIREMTLDGIPCIVGRVSFTGDLGYEIWMKPEYQRRIYDLLHEHGAAFGIRNVGLRAFLSLRLEKKFGTWGREYRPIYSPVECGLDRFCSTKKEADYIGRAAFEKAKAEGGALRLKTFVVDADDADAIGDEPVFHNGDAAAVGWITSGGFAHAAGKSVAMGYIPKAMAEDTGDGAFEIEILGQRRKATITEAPLFDANGSRMRS